MLRRVPSKKNGDPPVTSATSAGFGIVTKPFKVPSALGSTRTLAIPARKRKHVSYKEDGAQGDDGDFEASTKKMRFEMGNKVYENGVLGDMAKWCTRKFPVFAPKDKTTVFAKR